MTCCCNTLQYTATHCNTLQHTAAHCSTLQHTANALQHTVTHGKLSLFSCSGGMQRTATLCKRTATHCKNTATHCNALQHVVKHCNTLQHTVTHCNTVQHAATRCNTFRCNYGTPRQSLFSCSCGMQCVRGRQSFDDLAPIHDSDK